MSRYSQEFKETIVGLHHTGQSVADLSSEYGVTRTTIYKWIKEHSNISEKVEMTPAELRKIQKENDRLKMEIEILKKAMAIFAKK
jgi:transposase